MIRVLSAVLRASHMHPRCMTITHMKLNFLDKCCSQVSSDLSLRLTRREDSYYVGGVGFVVQHTSSCPQNPTSMLPLTKAGVSIGDLSRPCSLPHYYLRLRSRQTRGTRQTQDLLTRRLSVHFILFSCGLAWITVINWSFLRSTEGAMTNDPLCRCWSLLRSRAFPALGLEIPREIKRKYGQEPCRQSHPSSRRQMWVSRVFSIKDSYPPVHHRRWHRISGV